MKADKMKGKGGKTTLSGNAYIETLDGMRISCNEATADPKTGGFNAHGNVHLTKGTSMNIYSETLDYDGKTKKGKFRRNVKLIDEKSTLTTEFLDFFSSDNSGYFYNGGEIVDSAYTLTSKKGYYYPNKNLYVFVDSVVVHNEQYDLFSDTLDYNLVTSVVNVHGPTEIKSDENYIYCENGWYDMNNDVAQFNKNALLKNNLQELTGDSLFYDRKKGIGEAFWNIRLWDSEENIIIKGNYALYHENPEKAFVTDSAMFIQIGAQNLDSLYLHADTLKSEYDTTGAYKIVKAYYKAQVFKSDFQARADSAAYSLQDSVIRLNGMPTMWSDVNQITADFVDIHVKDNNLDFVEMRNNSFIISLEDSAKYNQIKGLNMTAFFTNNELQRIEVDKNGNSVYYARDGETFIGVNKSESSKMNIHMKNRKVQKVVFMSKPTSTLYPLDKITPEELKMDGFRWLETYRPSHFLDIFEWKPFKKSENASK